MKHNCCLLVPTHSKIGQEMRVHFEKLLDENGNHELIPVCLENDTPNFCLNREVKSEETHSVRDAEQNFEKTSQQSGKSHVSPTKTLNRDVAPIGDDIEPVGESRADVEEEISLEPEIHTVETNPKNPIRRAEQEREDCGHVVYRNWCAVCDKGRCVERQHQVEPLEEEERARTTPMVAFDCGFLTRENADTFPILICRDRFSCIDTFLIPIRRDDGHSEMKVTCFERKDSISYLSPFLVEWRNILKDKNELSMKVFRESRSHIMVRETKNQDRIPEDMIAKERGPKVKIKDEQQSIMKRQCRILRISAEHNTSVRITDEVSLQCNS